MDVYTLFIYTFAFGFPNSFGYFYLLATGILWSRWILEFEYTKVCACNVIIVKMCNNIVKNFEYFLMNIYFQEIKEACKVIDAILYPVKSFKMNFFSQFSHQIISTEEN